MGAHSMKVALRYQIVSRTKAITTVTLYLLTVSEITLLDVMGLLVNFLQVQVVKEVPEKYKLKTHPSWVI